MSIFLKTEDEIALMRKANALVADTLAMLAEYIKPGVTTLYLDSLAEAFIRDHGATPTFKGFPNPMGAPFPASICTSVNAMVVHGIPSAKEVLREGDIISVDCGAMLDGFNGDSAYTYCVGGVSDEIRQLLRVTKEALYKGIEAAVDGNRVGDIGAAVSAHCEPYGYGVVRELTGHGIGRKMHEEPKIPNYGKAGSGAMLRQGMCIAIEPMITLGSRRIGLMSDRWGIRTVDNKAAAHFEHTIVVRKGKAEILSSFEGIEQRAMGKEEQPRYI